MTRIGLEFAQEPCQLRVNRRLKLFRTKRLGRFPSLWWLDNLSLGVFLGHVSLILGTDELHHLLTWSNSLYTTIFQNWRALPDIVAIKIRSGDGSLESSFVHWLERKLYLSHLENSEDVSGVCVEDITVDDGDLVLCAELACVWIATHW